MASTAPIQRVFTFATTHQALWAEELAVERRIPAEVVPAPAGLTGRCNLALQTLPADLPAMEAALAAAGVPYELHPPRC